MSYKEKNNKKKKARAEFGIQVDGILWGNPICEELIEDPGVVDRNPNTWGEYKKRKSLKADVVGVPVLTIWEV